MIFGSVCSGIEAASVAWHPLGWRAAFLSDIDPFPRAVLKHHYPDVPLRGDFTEIQAGEHEPIELLVGGAMPEMEGDGTRAGALRAASGGSSRDYVALNLSPSTDNVLTATETNVSNALTAQGEARKNGNGLHLAERSAVRRLTPVECARLQGFPDDYLDITFRGRPAGDGAKYKALGNSMAVPVMRWIGERIQMVEALK